MISNLFHYYKRSRDLGITGTLRQLWLKISIWLSIFRQSLFWGWKAQKQMSDTELLEKISVEWHSMDELLEHLVSRPASSFLLPHDSQVETARILQNQYPDYVAILIATADAACRNELNLLDQDFIFPGGIDWNCDPVTKEHWPTWHRSRISKYLYSAKQSMDPIIFWELNRHQHFVTLGIAFWLTRNQKYVDAFNEQINNWIHENPIQHGLNWYYPLEVAIRLIAWVAAFQFFRNSPSFLNNTGRLFLKSLWQQIDFISSNLQTTRNDFPNNHMIAELTSLIIVGIAFPEFRAAGKWQETGLELLIEQATAQTHVDGVNKEQATGYHRFISELLLLIVARSRLGLIPRELVLEDITEKMLGYIQSCVSPSGTAPMWGDSDYGRALGLGIKKDFWDFRPLLSAGAVLFNRSDWKFVASHFDEESFWLLGPESLKLWDKLDVQTPCKTSFAFPQAGIYIIRDEWSTETDIAYFRCGPFGLGGEGRCAHAHSDLLSFMLWINGKPLLIDSGTYTYTGLWRDNFRLTSAHNTVKIDEYEQAIPVPNFNWLQIPEASCSYWNDTRVVGKLKCHNQVEFRRELSHPKPGTWELLDTFSGKNQFHKISWFFHFAAGLTLQWDEINRVMIIEDNSKPFALIFPANGASLEVKNGWFSRSYERKELVSVIHANWNGEISHKSQRFQWKFLKYE